MISPSQIRAARSIINAKQSELAKAAGISLATLNNIERGVGDPRTSTLDAIEKALAQAGVKMTHDDRSETVTLERLSRPDSYDTFFASQRVLETIGPSSLMKAEKILFFTRRKRDHPDDRPRICLLIEGANRTILFDQVDFNLAGAGRAAEVAGIMLAAFAFHRKDLFYLVDILDDTTVADAVEVVRRLRGFEWQALEIPQLFFNTFDSWEGRLAAYVDRAGHPMHNLSMLFGTRPQPAPPQTETVAETEPELDSEMSPESASEFAIEDDPPSPEADDFTEETEETEETGPAADDEFSSGTEEFEDASESSLDDLISRNS